MINEKQNQKLEFEKQKVIALIRKLQQKYFISKDIDQGIYNEMLSEYRKKYIEIEKQIMQT